MTNKIHFGGIAFIIGLVLAIVISLFSATTVPGWAIFLLALLGVVVGLFNVQESEVTSFLVAAITFLISFQALNTVFTAITFGWEGIAAFFQLMTVFIAPAAAIVAVIALFKLSRA